MLEFIDFKTILPKELPIFDYRCNEMGIWDQHFTFLWRDSRLFISCCLQPLLSRETPNSSLLMLIPHKQKWQFDGNADSVLFSAAIYLGRRPWLQVIICWQLSKLLALLLKKCTMPIYHRGDKRKDIFEVCTSNNKLEEDKTNLTLRCHQMIQSMSLIRLLVFGSKRT